MKKTPIRLFSLLLAAALCFGTVPCAVLAAGTDEYRQTTIEYLSKITNKYVTDSCYYSDDWFSADPAERNDGLALLSAQLSAAATDDPSYAENALQTLGFAVSDYDYYGGEDFDKTAFVVGKKALPGGKRLAVVVVQSDLYGERGWLQNVTVNREDAPKPDDHAAFSAAASYLLDTLGKDGCDVYWFAGASRGGAIANLAAAYAVDAGEDRVFAYTFESPATTANPDAHAGYGGIHNYAADDDPVTLLPPAAWGMTRYGTDVRYNREVTVEETTDALRCLNPDAAAYYTEGDSPNYNESYAEDEKPAALARIVGTLTAIVPERTAYTAPNDDPQDRFDGYTYQEGLRTLCSFVFGGGASMEDLKAELTGSLSAFLDEEDGMNRIIALLTELIYARMADIAAADASGETKDAVAASASEHYGNLTDAVLGLAGTRADYAAPKGVYALLRLLVPLLADPVLPAEEDLPTYDDFLPYNLEHYYDYDFDVPSRDLFNALLRIVGCVPTLVFSHQPDVILARMKCLAPAPDGDDLVLEIDEPKAGDAAGSVKAVIDAADALGFSWLEVTDAEWRTTDAELANDKAYYLDATLIFTGRSLPDDFSAKLNGREFGHRRVWHEDGRLYVSGSWLFVFGKVPAAAAVRFDTGGVCPAPDDMEVPIDTAFDGLAAPDPGLVKEEGMSWSLRFDGWFDENGTPWDELYTLGDMTVYAKWSMLIDEIALTYEIPREGDTGSALFRLNAPEGVPYEIREMSLCGENWDPYYYYDPEDPEAIVPEEGVERWVLGFFIHASSADMDFLIEGEGYDGIYLGTVTVNGEAVDTEAILYNPSWYDELEDETHPACLQIEFPFTFRSAEEDPVVSLCPGLPFGANGNGLIMTYDQLLALRELREKQNKNAAEPDRTPAAPAEEKTDPTPDQPEPPGYLPVFADVPADAYFAQAAAWASENGITTGTDGTHFSPDALCTRAEAVTFLWRLAGKPDPGVSRNPFADVPENAYYADAVLWAYGAGIVRGTDAAHFSPDMTVTRAQCVTLLYRMFGEKRDGVNPFSDVPDDAWYRDTVLWAVSAGVTRGKTEVLFAPDDACTRAQIVTFLYRTAGRS